MNLLTTQLRYGYLTLKTSIGWLLGKDENDKYKIEIDVA